MLRFLFYFFSRWYGKQAWVVVIRKYSHKRNRSNRELQQHIYHPFKSSQTYAWVVVDLTKVDIKEVKERSLVTIATFTDNDKLPTELFQK